MVGNSTLIRQLQENLTFFSNEGSIKEAAIRLLNTLGYRSKKRRYFGSVDQFLKYFPRLTERQHSNFKSWTDVPFIVQITNEEIAQKLSKDQTTEFNSRLDKSFLFIVVETSDPSISRAKLAETTRLINRCFKMPVILLFYYDNKLTLSVAHREPSRRDENRQVLTKVTLIKDIDTKKPHRAHLEILGELSLDMMISSKVSNFDELYNKWEETLALEPLNKKFYKKLFSWFETATKECQFPDDGAGSGSAERHVIRLITRILFVWFLKQKGLVPENLFEEKYVKKTLINHCADSTDYYRAILQNLFFATLNTDIDNRGFGGAKSIGDHQYQYQSLIQDTEAFKNNLKKIPFVNGGLFDCLDQIDAKETEGALIDVFNESDECMDKLSVPSRLFFDKSNGLFEILKHYKFTVEESTPLDREVALDPELLGLVFENLLAAYNSETRKSARNATGSFYTPRPVVEYMVQNALADTLAKICADSSCHQSWLDRLRKLLDYSFEFNEDELFEDSEKKRIVEAIANIKTLDPAVGSGAFPICILQTLTLVLRRLDPDNEIWEDEEQKKELDEISSTFEKYRQSDYGRKLYLIQNAIFGTDIQPIACQITKLRFFISLILEQEIDQTRRNFGIKPLPNLEMHIVAADSLLCLPPEADDWFENEKISEKIDGLFKVREQYFLANKRDKKLEYMEKDRKLRNSLQVILNRERIEWEFKAKQEIEDQASSLPKQEDQEAFKSHKFKDLKKEEQKWEKLFELAHMISDWDPYNQNGCSKWFDPKYMFGFSSGFDLVIGNPPYIQFKNDKSLANKYCNANFDTFKKSGDIYQIFFERGCKLLNDRNGVLVYITSNSWLKTIYGKPLRNWFLQHYQPIRLIEMGKDIFESAIVDSSILFVSRRSQELMNCDAVDIDRSPEKLFPPAKKDWLTLRANCDGPWMILSSEEKSIMKKMESAGTPLKNWNGISIYRGITTSFNDAFIINSETKDRLVAEHKLSEEIIKPVV